MVTYFPPITSLTLIHISYFKLFSFFFVPASSSARPLCSGVYLLLFLARNFFILAYISTLIQVLEVKRWEKNLTSVLRPLIPQSCDRDCK